MANAAPIRFRDKAITFANGSVGETIAVPSASPTNYHHVIAKTGDMAKADLDGKLFLPPASKRAAGKLPLVIIVPGSLGVAPSHVTHAETLTDNGIAAFVLDNFGGRDVTSTVANQTQFSFAASAYDVLAAWAVLSGHPAIDATRIGAQGHSRGGSAVLSGATRCFADAVIGKGRGMIAILAAYPWCGHQFLDPRVGTTEVRVLMGDADEWCSPMQAQGHVQALRLAGSSASIRLFAGAQHSFDRGTDIVNVPDAAVSPAAPTAWLGDDGAFVHPIEGTPNPALVDRDLMVYGLKAGYGRKGARIGSRDGDDKAFRDDMVAFWRRVMEVPA